MLRLALLALTAAAIPALSTADTKLTITLEDRDPSGSGTSWCRPSFAVESSSDVVEGIVSLAAENGPADLCWFRHRENQREGPYCSSEEDAAIACDSLATLTVQRLACSAESGEDTGCGEVTLVREGAGSVTPDLAAGAGERAEVGIVIAPLVDKDLFGDPWGCEIDTEIRFTPRDDARKATVSYAIEVGDRDGGSCEVTLSSFTRSGSCGGGVKDYTCADITAIEVTGVACTDGAGEPMDCGSTRTTVLGHDGR